MNRDKKPTVRVSPAKVDETLAETLGNELEGHKSDGARSATGWNEPYRASGNKHQS